MSDTPLSENHQRLLQAHNQNLGAKRKRSPSSVVQSPHVGVAGGGPPPKAPRTNNPNSNNSTQLQINYIARQCNEDLPFVSKDSTLPALLDVLASYTQVLDRHESLASNLGARPLGPILIKRFERCFDAPPNVIASHSHARDHDLPQVTWLDVVHFAQAHPSQFSLATFSEGRRVCQFYYPQKQVRVQISEEDFLFINSGRCQDLIPPLPIWEDEEKEVATCDIVEKQLKDVTAAADSVAARTRQLAHRLKGRRMAILERRAAEESHNQHAQQQQQQQQSQPPPPPSQAQQQPQQQQQQHQQHVQGSIHPAFVPVNAQATPPQHQQQQQQQVPAHQSDSNIRDDLLKHFQSLPKQPPQPDRVSSVQQQPMSPSYPAHHQTPPPVSAVIHHQSNSSSVSPVPTNVAALAAAASAQVNSQNYQSSSQRPYGAYPENYSNHHTPVMDSPKDGPRHNFSKPLPPNQEVSQPYRAICQAHMEALPRGSRVLPPCDRCRRLKMDCLKNLSSCVGCTKKHARCHWKDVNREEVQGLDGFEEAERMATDFDRRISEYAPSETSMDVDSTRRQSVDYELGSGHTVTPNPSLQQQQRPQYQEPTPAAQYQQGQPQPQQQQQRSQYEEPTSNDQRSAQPRAQPFPEENPSQQQNQHQNTNHHTMDLIRMLGSDTTRDQASSPNSGANPRNNGAFRSVYASNAENGSPATGANGMNGVNGTNGIVEGEGQRA